MTSDGARDVAWPPSISLARDDVAFRVTTPARRATTSPSGDDLSSDVFLSLPRSRRYDRADRFASWAERYRQLADWNRAALEQLVSVDPDGTFHGVVGAERFGYFEASPNHDAVALGVVNDTFADEARSNPDSRSQEHHSWSTATTTQSAASSAGQ